MADLTSLFEPPGLRRRALPLRRLVQSAVAGWPLVGLSALAATLLTVLALRLLPAEYTASMVVGPIARSGASAMGARAPVAVRPDIPLSVLEFGSGDEILSDFTRFMELLTSPTVAARLIAEPDLLPHLFPERWDVATGHWQVPGGLTGWLRAAELALVGRTDWIEPDAEIVSRQLRRAIVIQPLGTNPMRRILYRDTDRAFAVKLLERLAAAADAHLRAEASRRAAAEIAYIRNRMNATTVAEYRKALADLLADQERVAMMIEVDLPFAADPIEPPIATARPDWPNPLVVLPLASAAGLGLGLFLVFACTAWRDHGEPPVRTRRHDESVE